jgi:hypothetical protein
MNDEQLNIEPEDEEVEGHKRPSYDREDEDVEGHRNMQGSAGGRVSPRDDDDVEGHRIHQQGGRG